MSKPIIDLREITKRYILGDVTVDALKGITFTITEGEMVAIVGTSGCGKSTLMNIMGLLDKPTSGKYLVDGKETEKLDDNAISTLRNQKIGFVFQSYNLLAKLNVLDNVAIPLLYRGWPERKIKPRCREMLVKVKMGDREHHTPNELSGGQQQRVAIARALAGNPALLLADEPTGALDHRTSDEVMDLFTELNQKEGITVVLITHSVEIAERCPRRLILRDGSLVGDER